MAIGGSEGGLFPSSPRVFYERAPLKEVICQLRFPPILRIETQVPADFQERIRHRFPFFEAPSTPGLPQIPPEIAQMIAAQAGSPGYKFTSENGDVIVLLSKDSISMTASSYKHWEDFSRIFEVPLNSLFELYSPAFFTRIGLRYRNFIDRDELGFSNVPWSKLLRKELAGELAFDGIEEHSLDVRRLTRFSSPPSNSVLLQHGFSNTGASIDKSVYIIDFDFASDQKTGTGDARQVLEGLHTGAGDAFRWSISEELHHGLLPVEC